jgi:hypothetical protein
MPGMPECDNANCKISVGTQTAAHWRDCLDFLPRHLENSERRDAIDLDIERAGKRGHVKEDAGWRLAREKTRINVIEDREVFWLGRAIDIALEHLRKR